MRSSMELTTTSALFGRVDGLAAPLFRQPLSNGPSRAVPVAHLNRLGMACTLYVGGMSFVTSENRLKQEFEAFGEVSDVRIIMDPTGRSRGFGFVTFVNDEDAHAAQKARDQSVLAGRIVTVNLAKENQQRKFSRSGPGYRGPAYEIAYAQSKEAERLARESQSSNEPSQDSNISPGNNYGG